MIDRSFRLAELLGPGRSGQVETLYSETRGGEVRRSHGPVSLIPLMMVLSLLDLGCTPQDRGCPRAELEMGPVANIAFTIYGGESEIATLECWCQSPREARCSLIGDGCREEVQIVSLCDLDPPLEELFDTAYPYAEYPSREWLADLCLVWVEEYQYPGPPCE